MTTRVNTIIYPVKDLAKARELFSTLLGATPYADQPYYVGFKVEEQEFGLDPNGHAQGMTGPVAYYRVADIRQSRQALLDAGATPAGDVRDVGGGRLIATITDPDGNPIGLMQDA